jgi:NAD(P)-dependent dehydrogenase (short-subunit alcohol dehydrogenase family)
MMNRSKVWLVTSAARGVGRVLTEAVLDGGDRVVALARDPRPLDDLAERYVRRFTSFALDPSDERDMARTVLQAREHFGRLDVVINDASDPTDDVDEAASVRALTEAVLPVLKLQRFGHLFELSVAARRDAVPAAALAELGVRLTTVERHRDGAIESELPFVHVDDAECPFGDRLSALLGVDREARAARATTRAILRAVDSPDPARRIVVEAGGRASVMEANGAWVGMAGAAAAAMMFFKG